MTLPPDAFGHVIVRTMQAADIPAVMDVEHAAFDRGWAATSFQRELADNRMARYVVLEVDATIVGFGGVWLMVDEAHVVTVAVRPDYRRHGFGRLLVHGLVQLAGCCGMLAATLECRVSNAAARALYSQYGFYEVGNRPRYYQDNQEDAVIMTTEEFAAEPYQRRLRMLAETLAARFPGVSLGVEGCCVSSHEDC